MSASALPHISFFDLLIFFYWVWRMLKGWRGHLGKELEALTVSLLFLASSLGIFIISHLSGFIQVGLQLTLLNSGFLISLFISWCSFLLAVVLFWFLRSKIAELCERQFSQRQNQYGGSIVGGLRGLSGITILVLWLSYLPFSGLEQTRQQSVFARNVGALVIQPASQTSQSSNTSNTSHTSQTTSPIEDDELEKGDLDELIKSL